MTKPFIVAEMSANHLGSFDRALKIVEAAAKAGADAIKLQTFDPDEMAADYHIQSGPWAGRNLRDLYREARTPRPWHPHLFDAAQANGIECFSTPFSFSDLLFLEALDCPRYKIASFELVDLPLIRRVAKTGKPMIMSTGMATHGEILEAVSAARENGCTDLTLLKCTSGYPAPIAEANLVSMVALRSCGTKVGISDHTRGGVLGGVVSICAAFLGADVIEKHLTLSREDGGPDAEFSMDPLEFEGMVVDVRDAAQAYGKVKCGPTESELPQLALRRSLYFARPVKRGQPIVEADLRTARPALGLMPREFDRLIGQAVKRDVEPGQPVTWDVIA